MHIKEEIISWVKTYIKDFPKPHTDLLEQFINYKTPLDKFDELAKYYGSVIVKKTKRRNFCKLRQENSELFGTELCQWYGYLKQNYRRSQHVLFKDAMAFIKGEKTLIFRDSNLQLRMVVVPTSTCVLKCNYFIGIARNSGTIFNNK